MNLWLRSVQGAVGCLMLLAAAGCSKSESVSQQAHYATLTVQPADRELLSAYSASIRGQEYIVEEGLTAGEVIVAEGVGLLREGTVVSD